MRMYASERIANIKELEDIISRSYQISQILSQELCVSPIDASKAKALSESLARELNDAKNFEICVMRTESIWADEQSKVDREATSKIDADLASSRLLREGLDSDFKQNSPIKTGGLTSIVSEIEKKLKRTMEGIEKTQDKYTASMHMSEEAVKESNKALILSLISLGVTVIGAVATVLTFLL